jgi:hypothetical protein
LALRKSFNANNLIFQTVEDGFEEGYQFAWRRASLSFNSATLGQVFGLAQVLEREQPIPVRGAMYRGIPQLFKDSSDKYYECCGRLILKMRRLGLIPFYYIADNTRNRRIPSSWSGLADFAQKANGPAGRGSRGIRGGRGNTGPELSELSPFERVGRDTAPCH